MLSETLHRLCREDYDDGVEKLLQGLFPVTTGEVDENSPEDQDLCEQQQQRAAFAVRQLINSRDQLRNAPIHNAIFARNVNAIKSLILFGADTNLKCHGNPPLHLIITTAALPGGANFFNDCKDAFFQDNAFNFTSKDDQGYTAAHIAAGLGLHDELSALIEAFPAEIRDQLVLHRPRISGITALHRCASAVQPSCESARLLLTACSDGGSSLLTAQNLNGETALHLAAQRANKEFLLTLLRAVDKPMPLVKEVKDYLGRTVEDILRANHLKLKMQKGSISLVEEVRGGGDITDENRKGPTAIVSSPLCKRHLTCSLEDSRSVSAPPENIIRLEVLIDEKDGVLRSSDLLAEPSSPDSPVALFLGGGAAPLSDVLRVHEWAYVRKVQDRCDRLRAEAGQQQLAYLDGDTAICADSFDAALHAAGSVCRAVDMVLSGQAKNAFCPIRPPGHHAGPRGVVRLTTESGPEGPDSHGFCLLNNISIGAAYALNRHRDKVKKVAIVDFDVHHGNGTEETIRWLRPSLEASSVANEVCFGKVFAPRYKPWFDGNDADNVLFVSVHGYGPRERGLEHLMPLVAFYPGSGKTSLPQKVVEKSLKQPESEAEEGDEKLEVIDAEDKEELDERNDDQQVDRPEQDDLDNDDDDDDDEDGDYDAQQGDEDDDDDDDDDEKGRTTSIDAPKTISELEKMYTISPKSGEELPPLQIIDVGVPLPADDVSIAAPFDEKDQKVVSEWAYRIQWRNYFRNEIFPRLLKFRPDCIFLSAGFDAHKKDTINAGYIALVEDDFEWLTQQLCAIAELCCEGRVVSALEGGYQLGGRCCSAFARSVKAHVQSLAVAAKYGHLSSEFSLEKCQAEAETEEQFLQKLVERSMGTNVPVPLEESTDIQPVSIPDTDQAGEPATVEPDAPSSDRRKRRRAEVDYVALDLELRKKNGLSST